MLGTLEPEQKQDWKKYLPSLVYSYNATKHESTGFSPFELMFGRKAKLPVDSAFQLDPENAILTTDYVKDLVEKMEETKATALKSLEKSKHKQKINYDKKAKPVNLNVGDKVLVKILAFTGPNKLADKFEEDVYDVVGQPNLDLPVFDVRSPDGLIKRL